MEVDLHRLDRAVAVEENIKHQPPVSLGRKTRHSLRQRVLAELAADTRLLVAAEGYLGV